MRALCLAALLTHSVCFALQERPWFGQMFEFHLRPQYAYTFFDKVDRSTAPLSGTFFQHLLALGCEVTVPPTWNYQVEVDFADTTPISWGYRSAAIQVTKLWFDDVCGDLLSLTTGISYRDSSARLRRALTTPFHARGNFELHAAAGKEWSERCDWIFRTYGTVAIGQGTRGAAWFRGDLFFWWNFCDVHQLRFYAKSYFGLGKQDTVPLPDFRGWSRIGHQSIDLGGSYRYQFDCFGSLRLDYLYRVYARSYPERVHCLLLTYNFPFCPF